MSLVALGSSLTVGAAPSFPKAYKTSLETPEVYQALMPGVNSQSDRRDYLTSQVRWVLSHLLPLRALTVMRCRPASCGCQSYQQ